MTETECPRMVSCSGNGGHGGHTDRQSRCEERRAPGSELGMELPRSGPARCSQPQGTAFLHRRWEQVWLGLSTYCGEGTLGYHQAWKRKVLVQSAG